MKNLSQDSNEISEADETQITSGEATEERKIPSEKEILHSLSENTTATEFTQLMRILQEDPESDYEPEEGEERHYSDCTETGDRWEKGRRG